MVGTVINSYQRFVIVKLYTPNNYLVKYLICLPFYKKIIDVPIKNILENGP